MEIEKRNSNYNMKVRSVDIIIFFSFFVLFKPAFIPSNIQIIIRVTLIMITSIYIIFKVKFRNLFNASLLVVAPIVVSCSVNYYKDLLSFQNLLNGLLYAIRLYNIYTIFLYCKKIRYEYNAFLIIYNLLKIYSFISILSIIIVGPSTNNFFFGTKYPTSYLLILFVSFYYIKNKQKFYINSKVNIRYFSKYLILFFVTSLFIWIIGCRTGTISFLMCFILSFSGKKAKKIMSKPVVVILALVVSALFVFIIGEILQLGFVQSILTLLGKDVTLSDRIRYYQRIGYVISKCDICIGYGYSSDYMKSIIAYGSNIQNGLLQHLIEYGLCGSIGLLVFIYYSIKKTHMNNWGFYMYLYTMIIAAIVEISISAIFFLCLFIMRWVCIKEEKNSFLVGLCE